MCVGVGVDTHRPQICNFSDWTGAAGTYNEIFEFIDYELARFQGGKKKKKKKNSITWFTSPPR